jgi:hypothetical protein
MNTVLELLSSCTAQAHLDTNEVLDLLVEFCADSGMGDAVVTTLSEQIEEEGIVDKLREFLAQRGLIAAAGDSINEEQLLDDDDELDLDDIDLE